MSPTTRRVRGGGHDFKSEMRSMQDYGAQASFYNHPSTFPEQHFTGGLQGGFVDHSLSMVTTPGMYAPSNGYGYFPSSSHQVIEVSQSIPSSHGQAMPSQSECSITGFAPPAQATTQFGSDWFHPAQRQLQGYDPAMQMNAASSIQYTQAPLAYATYGTTYYPYLPQQPPSNSYGFQQSSASIENTLQNAMGGNRITAPVVESH